MIRFGSPPRPGVAYRRRPGVYAVILRGDRVLVTEQSEPRVEIQLPGGGIDPGESALQALQRETLEETGFRLSVQRRLGVYQWFTYMPEYRMHAQKICHVYLCRPTLRVGPPAERFHRAIWMQPKDAVRAFASRGDAYFTARVTGVL